MSKIYLANKNDMLTLGNNIAPIVQDDIDAAYTAAAAKGATLPAVGSRTLANLAATLATIPGDRFDKWLSASTLFTELNVDVVTLRAYAFTSSAKLSKIVLPDCVSIGVSAFSGCTGLTSISCPECVTIGQNSFNGCTAITKLTADEFPKLQSWAGQVFNGCSRIEIIDLPNVTTVAADSVVRIPALHTLRLPMCTTIGTTAFQQNTALKTVTLPSITNIGVDAFSGCTSIETIDVRPQESDSVRNNLSALMNTTTSNFPAKTTVHINCADGYLTFNSSTNSWDLNAYEE